MRQLEDPSVYLHIIPDLSRDDGNACDRRIVCVGVSLIIYNNVDCHDGRLYVSHIHHLDTRQTYHFSRLATTILATRWPRIDYFMTCLTFFHIEERVFSAQQNTSSRTRAAVLFNVEVSWNYGVKIIQQNFSLNLKLMEQFHLEQQRKIILCLTATFNKNLSN